MLSLELPGGEWECAGTMLRNRGQTENRLGTTTTTKTSEVPLHYTFASQQQLPAWKLLFQFLPSGHKLHSNINPQNHPRRLLKTRAAPARLPPSLALRVQSYPSPQTPQEVPCSRTHLSARWLKKRIRKHHNLQELLLQNVWSNTTILQALHTLLVFLVSSNASFLDFTWNY